MGRPNRLRGDGVACRLCGSVVDRPGSGLGGPE